MSTIPAGLRADYMRERMEDKATLTQPGSLYVAGTEPVTYHGAGEETLDRYETVELPIGAPYFVLTSNGSGNLPSYQQITEAGIANRSITKNKLGAGTIVAADDNRMLFDIAPDANDSNILVISFYPFNL